MKLKILINKFLLYLSYTLKLEKNLGKPIIRQIEPTNACMMDCVMCPRKNMTRKIKYMSLELFKKIIDQLKWNDNIWLLGFGDPIMHPKIDEMIKYLVSKGIKTKISVNPKLLSEEMCRRLISSGLHTLLISVDGIDDKSYKYFRGKNANYKEAMQNIDNVLKIKKEENSNMQIHVQMILMKKNKHYVDKFKKKWDIEGVNRVLITSFITYSGSDPKIIEQGDDDTFSDKFKTKKEQYCSEPFIAAVITVDGNVVPCCYDYNEMYVLGDLKKKTLKEIWNDKPARLLRRQVKNKTLYKNPLCKSCLDKKDERIHNVIRRIINKREIEHDLK